MERIETRLEGPVLLAPSAHADERGFFLETFRKNVWAEHGVDVEFIQDNHSRSRRGTVRGMHFQTEPGQAKLIRAARGEILDVLVDIRRGSPTFGEWESFELTEGNFRQLFVPVGFAHGFCVTSDVADVTYKCSSYYDGETESGIAFDDPGVGIEWPTGFELLYSQRDATAPRLAEIADDLPFSYE